MAETPELDLSIFHLRHGGHRNPEHGLCVMEAVAFVAGEKHTDQPQCACPVLTRFAQRVNDRMNDGERAALTPFILKLAGTRSEDHILQRLHYVARQVVKRGLPIIFDYAEIAQPKLKGWAEKFRSIPDDMPLPALAALCREGRDAADAAYAASAAYAAYAASAASAADAASAAYAADAADAAYAAYAAYAASAAYAAYAASAASAADAASAAYAADAADAAYAAYAASAASAAYAAYAEPKTKAEFVAEARAKGNRELVAILDEAIHLGPNSGLAAELIAARLAAYRELLEAA
jgi:hypothetical protein